MYIKEYNKQLRKRLEFQNKMIDIDFALTKRKGKGVRRYTTKQQLKKAVE